MSQYPQTGTVTSSAVTPTGGSATFNAGVATIGPLNPLAGKEIWVTLSGTWTGTAQVMRSTDNGTTLLPLTVGGSAWGLYTTNANEQTAYPSDTAGAYFLVATITSGTLIYRVAQ
jgi:hypothetical protein